jgi:two-component system, OmpR family, response regulator
MNILLAEDDVNFGRVLKTELEEERCAVDLVPNGVEAVLSFLSKTYDLVLLDIRMPRLSGNDTLKIIKRMNPHVPVITFSGNAGSHEIAESIECGAVKCLIKPFEISQLRWDVKNLILK